MSGTKEGAAKSRAKNLAKDPDFYKKIGAMSWKNPDRSHETGFALVPEELRKELGAQGGRKTKIEYRVNIYPTFDKEGKIIGKAFTIPTETNQDRTGVSE